MKLTGRTVLITGGTSGIGFELAKQLLERKSTVLITGRDRRKLDEAASRLPSVKTFLCDVSSTEQIAELQREVVKDFPACDTLFNNAGIMRNLDMNVQRSLPDVTQEVDINLSGPIQMVQAFLPHLKRKPSALLVNVSSGLAYVPFPLSPVYSAAKAGVHAFTRCLRVQLKGTNVSVVELSPPGVETKLFRDGFERELRGQKGMAVDLLVAKATRGIEEGRSEVRPGLSNVLYILSRLAPSLPFGQMAKMYSPSS